MDVIVYMKDGNLCRVTPAKGYTAEQVVKDVPQGVSHKIVENDNMPSHVLRGAWKLSGSSVDVDMVKGKDIAHTLRREKRTEALADNIEIIKQGSAGIPLKAGQSVETAQSENAAFMLIDDANQVSIDSATNEADLLSVIESL